MVIIILILKICFFRNSFSSRLLDFDLIFSTYDCLQLKFACHLHIQAAEVEFEFFHKEFPCEVMLWVIMTLSRSDVWVIITLSQSYLEVSKSILFFINEQGH